MAVDTGFYRQPQIEQASLLDAANTSVKFGELGVHRTRVALEKQKLQQQMDDQNAMKSAYANNTDESGVLNRQKFLGDLGKAAPMKSIEAQGKFLDFDSKQADYQRKQLDSEINKMGIAANLAMSAKDQPSYDKVLGNMQDMGLDTSHMPNEFDPGLMRRLAFMSAKQGERLQGQKELFDEANKRRTLDQGDRKLSIQEQKNKLLAQQLANKQKDKGSLLNEKRTTALKDDLDPNKARGGNLAKSQLMINSAQRVEALFQQFPDGNIPKSQTVELANAVAALIGGGGSAQSQQQINEITPHSLIGDSAAIASWLTNEPLGAQQKEFTNLLRETAKREGSLAETQVKQAQVQRLTAHDRLKESDPETYWSVLHGYGIEPRNVKNGKYSNSSSQLADMAKELTNSSGDSTSPVGASSSIGSTGVTGPAGPTGVTGPTGPAPAQVTGPAQSTGPGPVSYKPAPQGQVSMKTPSGKIKYVPAADAQGLTGKGWEIIK